MSEHITDIEPELSFALWGYHIGGDILEKAATVAEGKVDLYEHQWDDPSRRDGYLSIDGERRDIPWSWALPYAESTRPS